MREWRRRVDAEIAGCEKILCKKLSDDDQTWIGLHIGNMMRAERKTATRPSEGGKERSDDE